MTQTRSWLFAPGHDQRLLNRIFERGADAVILDLEDAVPPSLKDRARDLVAEVAAAKSCWVRVNRAMSVECELDLKAIRHHPAGIRLPKVESPAEVEWVAERAPGIELDCTIESSRGVLAAREIAASSACSRLSYGGLDLAADAGMTTGDRETLVARSLLVLAARAADKPPPSDGVYPVIDDLDGLRAEALGARKLGFFGKAAIHPNQIATINEVFEPTRQEIEWARRVLEAFDAAGGAATRTATGEFVDKPVAARARRLLGH
jgi:citrate lyase subunit beta / citryl-CoA lyase